MKTNRYKIVLVILGCASLSLYGKENFNGGRDIQKELKDAIFSQDTGKVEELIEEGADPNQTLSPLPRTPLTAAIELGDRDMVRVLLKNGADPKLADADENDPADFAWSMRHGDDVYTTITLDIETAAYKRGE